MSEVNMIQMTVTQALRERKVLNSRIERAIREGVYLGVVEGESKRPVNKAYRTVEDLTVQINASTDRVTSLMKRYNDIVAALILSNATTTVTVAGDDMTVAAAIERRNSFAMTMNFIAQLTQQQNTAVNDLTTRQRTLDANINQRVANNKTESMDAAQISELTANSKAVLEREFLPQIHDPRGNGAGLQSIREKAELFLDELETQLNIVNATTMIEIPA